MGAECGFQLDQHYLYLLGCVQLTFAERTADYSVSLFPPGPVMTTRRLIIASAALSALDTADAHGAVVIPAPRNGIDRDLAPWNGPAPTRPTPSVETKTGWCPVVSLNGTVTGQNGQACFWFSNGASIGCPVPDGTSRGPIPNSKDPAKRTVNTGVACGADDDWYYYSPWRAPGSSGVFDACGMAGGHKPPDGGFGGIYVNTTHAKLGDRGTDVLPRGPPTATWTQGAEVEVSWAIEANHGGGYQYRLCPAENATTEACFQRMPLPFVGQQGLRWYGRDSPDAIAISFKGVYVTEGVSPPGAAWAMNPIPRNDEGQTGKGFAPRCTNASMCQGMEDGSNANPNMEIVDKLQVPLWVPAGDYVLGWRWDCEESNQIWQSCSDITIVAP